MEYYSALKHKNVGVDLQNIVLSKRRPDIKRYKLHGSTYMKF
jgi:hypothetical protein